VVVFEDKENRSVEMDPMNRRGCVHKEFCVGYTGLHTYRKERAKFPVLGGSEGSYH
jgi:hypothetical protein